MTTGAKTHIWSRRLTTETKSAVKTTELLAYVVTVIAAFGASAVADDANNRCLVATISRSSVTA